MIPLVAAVTIFFASFGAGLIGEKVSGGRKSTAGGAFIAAQIVLTTIAIGAL